MKKDRFGQAEPLTKNSFKAVFYALEHPVYRLIFTIAWYTAERPGTILKLRVSDVFHRGEVRETIVFPRNTRKDRKTRECPVHAKLKPLLAEYDAPLDGWLFPSSRDPLKPVSFKAYSRYLTRKFEELGMQGYSTYSTRRGAITELARAGLSAPHIQAISGHRSLASLQRYIETDPEQVRRGINLL